MQELSFGIAELATELERKLAAFGEPRIRAAIVCEQLERLDPGILYGLAAHVLRGARMPLLRDALREFLLARAPADAPRCALRAELERRARAAGDELVADLVRPHSPSDLSGPAAPELHVDLGEVPLGRRRSLARGRDPLLLEKLARDPDPVVIANLLANPRICESDVVRIASQRPTAASSLLEIGQSERWRRRTRVRAALAQNPFCPLELALAQLHELPLADLREIGCAVGLDRVLRAHAGYELRRRARGGG